MTSNIYDRCLPNRLSGGHDVNDQWTLAVLDADGESSPADVRYGCLKKLTEKAYVPPESWHQAAWALDHQYRQASATNCPASVQVEYEAALAERIAVFARELFDSEPEVRHALWHSLRGKTNSFRLIARLDLLAVGLSLDVLSPSSGSLEVQKLIDAIRELIVLAPSAQASRRRQLVCAADYSPASLRQAVAELKRDYPQWASAGSEYLQALLTHFSKYPTDFTIATSVFDSIMPGWDSYNKFPAPPTISPKVHVRSEPRRMREAKDPAVHLRWLIVPLILFGARLMMSLPSSKPPGNPGTYKKFDAKRGQEVLEFIHDAHRHKNPYQVPVPKIKGKITVPSSDVISTPQEQEEQRKILGKVLGVLPDRIEIAPAEKTSQRDNP